MCQMYCNLNNFDNEKVYLKMPIAFPLKKHYVQARIGTLPLRVHTGRFERPRIVDSVRICRNCCMNTCENLIHYWTLRYLAKVHHKGSGNWFLRQTSTVIFLQNWNRNLVHLLNICQSGWSAIVILLSHRLRGICCPSDLGEYSLVRCCSLQNLHGVFGYGLQCFMGPEDFVSGNSFVSKNYNFFNAISFSNFLTLKI